MTLLEEAQSPVKRTCKHKWIFDTAFKASGGWIKFMYHCEHCGKTKLKRESNYGYI